MEVLATALEGRAAKRQYWEDRERDKVFKSLPPEARPMPWPNAELHAKTNAWRAAGGEGGGTTGGPACSSAGPAKLHSKGVGMASLMRSSIRKASASGSGC